MSSSKKKALWATSGFQSRTTEDRQAYRAKVKAENKAFYAALEARVEQPAINAAQDGNAA